VSTQLFRPLESEETMTQDALAPRCFTHRAAGIDWYCEQRGAGPVIVLVPSGEGDCSSYEQVARLLADSFTVLTFDMPGFSRSSAPDAEPWPVGAPGQIAELVSSLGIERASFYGCSSGGAFVLWLALDHPDIVRNAMIHEMAMVTTFTPEQIGGMLSVVGLDDAAIMAANRERNAGALLGEDTTQLESYKALGTDYRDRVERNMVTWIRRYVAQGGWRTEYDPAELAGRPIDWTIGGLTPAQFFFGNVLLAVRAGLPISWLPCRHAPHLTIPNELAAHLRATTLRYLA